MLKEILERLMVENQEYQETQPQDQQENQVYGTTIFFFPYTIVEMAIRNHKPKCTLILY